MNAIIKCLGAKNIFTTKIIFARSLLAIAGLLVILFNPTILSLHNLGEINQNFFATFSLFHLIGVNYGRVLSILILLFAISGYFPQISCFLQAWVHLSICVSFVLIDGGDQLAANLSLLLIPICIFDRRINQWKNSFNDGFYRNIFFNVYYFLIRMQMAVVYLHAGIGKLDRPDWRDGTCLYYWFTDNMIGVPRLMQKMATPFLLSRYVPILAWSVIFLELGLFACILATNTNIKKIFLFLGIFFHVLIALFFGLITFSLIVISGLILYLDVHNVIFNYLEQKVSLCYSKLDFLKKSS